MSASNSSNGKSTAEYIFRDEEFEDDNFHAV